VRQVFVSAWLLDTKRVRTDRGVVKCFWRVHFIANGREGGDPMRTRWIGLVLAVVVGGARLGAQRVTIDNVTIVDVTNGKLQPHKTIVVDGTRIARIE